MTIWRMRIAFWIPKATNTHSGYVTHIPFLIQQWLHEHTLMLLYMPRYLSGLYSVPNPCLSGPHTSGNIKNFTSRSAKWPSAV